eukprot:sb/3475268/
MKVKSDPDLGTPSGERLLSTILGLNKVNFLNWGKEILSLNRGVPKSGVPKSGSDCTKLQFCNGIVSSPLIPYYCSFTLSLSLYLSLTLSHSLSLTLSISDLSHSLSTSIRFIAKAKQNTAPLTHEDAQ